MWLDRVLARWTPLPQRPQRPQRRESGQSRQRPRGRLHDGCASPTSPTLCLLAPLLLLLLSAHPAAAFPLNLEKSFNEVLAAADESLGRAVPQTALILARDTKKSLPSSYYCGLLNPHLYWMQDIHCDSIGKRLAFVSRGKHDGKSGDDFHISTWKDVTLSTGERRFLEEQVGYNDKTGCKIEYFDTPFMNPMALVPTATFVGSEVVEGHTLDRWRQRRYSPSDLWFDHDTQRPVRVRNIVGRDRKGNLEFVEFNIWAFEARDWAMRTDAETVFRPRPAWNCTVPAAPTPGDVQRVEG